MCLRTEHHALPHKAPPLHLRALENLHALAQDRALDDAPGLDAHAVPQVAVHHHRAGADLAAGAEDGARDARVGLDGRAGPEERERADGGGAREGGRGGPREVDVPALVLVAAGGAGLVVIWDEGEGPAREDVFAKWSL